MYSLGLLLFPALVLAAPTTLDARQNNCAPTSYTFSKFGLYPDAIQGYGFTLQSRFPDGSIINDPVMRGAQCDVWAQPDPIKTSEPCLPGPGDLVINLRAPVEKADYELVHTWRCNGETWRANTPHKVQNLRCGFDPVAGQTWCTSDSVTFAPQNVRKI